jgi:hypothetical protein
MSLVYGWRFGKDEFSENRLGRILSLQRVEKKAGSVMRFVHTSYSICTILKTDQRFDILSSLIVLLILVSTLKLSLQP